MICNENEKYLLDFISGTNTLKTKDFLEVISEFGIKIKFNDTNPVYQTIDEMAYGQTVGKR